MSRSLTVWARHVALSSDTVLCLGRGERQPPPRLLTCPWGVELLLISDRSPRVPSLSSKAVFTSISNPLPAQPASALLQVKTPSATRTACLKISSLIKLNSSYQPPPLPKHAETTLYEDASNIMGAFARCKGNSRATAPRQRSSDFLFQLTPCVCSPVKC